LPKGHNTEERRGTVSVFNGIPPEISVLDSPENEIAAVAKWLSALKTIENILPHEIGVFVRAPAQLERASKAVQKAGLPFKVLDEQIETISGYASIGTMHLAKGLEFRAVVVMACDDEIIPLQERCTRARDRLLVTGVKPASEFLDDLQRYDRLSRSSFADSSTDSCSP
jgi:superfamily I DNA/RNA helicase